jgi:hypothetical protein
MYPEIRNYEFSFEELNVSQDFVEEVMGYVPGSSPEPFPEMIASAMKQGPEVFTIQGSVAISDRFNVDHPQGLFTFEDTTFDVSKKITSQLKRSEGGIIFICTAGPGLDVKCRELMAAGEFMEGYILDVLGSVTVECAINTIQDKLATELEAHGIKITNRYSPGYCGWALSEQRKLFALFPDGHCGIRLSDSFLMEPIKSVSGVIGFGTKVNQHVYDCQLCELENCYYREIRMAHKKAID